jgi:diguanylate cyclase (GGDEF)-like protein/PAS domain S-box-containing protein
MTTTNPLLRQRLTVLLPVAVSSLCTALAVLAFHHSWLGVSLIIAGVALPTIWIGEYFDKEAAHTSKTLQQQMTMLRLIADNVPAMMGYIDTDERYVFGNRKYLSAFGILEENLAGMNVESVIGPQEVARHGSKLREALAGKRSYFERQVESGAWYRVMYQPDLRDDGSVAGVFVVADDITELKQTQAILTESDRELRMATDNVPVMLARFDRDQRYLFCNAPYQKKFAVISGPLLGMDLQEAVGAGIYAHLKPYAEAALAGQEQRFELLDSNNRFARHLSFHYLPDLDEAGMVCGFYSMIQDITERKEAELKLADSERLLRAVTDHLPVLVSLIDVDETFRFNNLAYERWLHKPLSEITGKRVREVYTEDIHTHFRPQFELALAGTLAESEIQIALDGKESHFKCSYVPQFDAQREVIGVCGLMSDISELKRIQQQLSDLAHFDTLTGLPNRLKFNLKMREAIDRSERHGLVMALMFLDIDHFKRINDTYGHAVGDGALVEFARRLLGVVRKTDTVVRLAGDEFVIILENLREARESELVAAKILQAMTLPFVLADVEHTVTTSIGIVLRAKGQTDGNQLLQRADEVLYRAKSAGRNTFAVATGIPSAE